ARTRSEPTFARVLEQVVDRIRRVLLVRPDDAVRAALDPARAVEARDGNGTLAQNAAAHVRNRAGALVVGNARKPDPPVTDAPEDDPARNHLALVGGDCSHAPPPVGLESVGCDLDGFHPLVTEDPDRGEAKPQAHDLRLAARLTRGELAEDVHVPLDDVRGG